jgi:3-oxoacyl-(acyl-carrier-protein) synthase
LGIRNGGLETFQIEVVNFAAGDGTPNFNPFFIPKMISDIACGHISIKYGFRGPNLQLFLLVHLLQMRDVQLYKIRSR